MRNRHRFIRATACGIRTRFSAPKRFLSKTQIFRRPQQKLPLPCTGTLDGVIRLPNCGRVIACPNFIFNLYPLGFFRPARPHTGRIWPAEWLYNLRVKWILLSRLFLCDRPKAEYRRSVVRNRTRLICVSFVLLLLAFLPAGSLAKSDKGEKKVVFVCACLKDKSCSCMTEAKMQGPCACGTEGGPPMKAVPADSDWAKQNRDALAK